MNGIVEKHRMNATAVKKSSFCIKKGTSSFATCKKVIKMSLVVDRFIDLAVEGVGCLFFG